MSQYFNFGVCGSGGVGKTCITIRITQGSYIGDFYDPTIDDPYEIKRNVDNKSVRLTINDTAGQDEYHCLLDITLRKVFGYVLVFDATSKKSLEDLNIFVKKIRNIRELNTPIIVENENITMEQQQQRQYNQENNKRKVDFPCVIVASKSDLPNVISESEVRKYMNEVLLLSKEVPLIYVSAKENYNINLLLETIVREMRKFTNEKEEQEEEKKKRDKVMKKKKRTTSSSGNSKRITKEKSSSYGGMFASVLGSSGDSGVEDDLDGLTY